MPYELATLQPTQETVWVDIETHLPKLDGARLAFAFKPPEPKAFVTEGRLDALTLLQQSGLEVVPCETLPPGATMFVANGMRSGKTELLRRMTEELQRQGVDVHTVWPQLDTAAEQARNRRAVRERMKQHNFQHLYRQR